MDDKLIASVLDQLEEEDSDTQGKQGLSFLSDPQTGPDGDGGDNDPKGPADSGPAEADGSNDDDPAVEGEEKPGEGGGDKLAQLVASLSDEEKAKLLALLSA